VNDLQELLREIASRGLSITASGADLRLQGPTARIDPALVGRIKAAKPELIALLSRPQPAEAAAEPEGFPLTLLQRGYLIGRGDAVEMGNVSSHIYHEIEGRWDLDRLEAALTAVVDRHGMLRTRFTPEGRQIEQPAPLGVRIGRLDLRGESAQAQQERLAALRRGFSHRVLPAGHAPMLAAQVSILADDRMLLQIGHDGLIMDAISMFLFFQAWWTAYTDGPGEPVEEASFADYVAVLEKAQTRAPYQRSRAHWLDRLDGLAPHPALPLRADPASITHPRFTQHTVRLGTREWAALKARGADAGLTPTALLMAAYAETLARWGAGERFTLNTTLANRPPIHPRITEAIGNFSETMLVEIELDRGATFRERALSLQAGMRRDIDNRHFSGIEVLRELARRVGPAQARMPYSFNSAIGYVRAGVDGSAVELFGPETYTSSQTPQLWLNGFAFEQHAGVIIQFDEVAGLFPDGLIEAMAAGYRTLLISLLGDEAWSARTFDLLPEEQKARRRAANDTAAPLPEHQLQDPFLAHAERAPDAPAVITSGGELTYGELRRRALAAANWLRDRQVGRGDLVGLVLSRGPEQFIGILAAVLAGAAYLPVDAALPEQRKRFLLRDGEVRCVLTNAPWTAEDGDGFEVLPLDATAPFDQTESAPVYTPVPDANPGDLAYVLYTSGTTGEPKGVMVSHRSVANVVADCNARFDVTAADRFFGISAFNFDLSVYDVFGALSAGAAVVLPDADRATDPTHWLDLCERAGVTVWNSVPAIVSLLSEQAAADGAEGLATLRLVLMSGDRIPPNLPGQLRRLKAGLSVVSLGGPTETTIWNILHPIGPEEGDSGSGGAQSIPYGRPNSNNRAYVLDAAGQDAPDWITGEICAAGTGLARGYRGDEARTAERFFHDAERGERLYRTGDLGRYRPDGEIEILGRSDFQIKVNGYRIEAGEVETRLVGIPAIKQAAVVRQSGSRGEPPGAQSPGAHLPGGGSPGSGSPGGQSLQGDRLVAHLVPAGDERPSQDQIRLALRVHLPEYMIPSATVWHESLPLTRNSKVDRVKLASASAAAAAAAPAVGAGRTGNDGTATPPATELESQVAELWAGVLHLSGGQIEPGADFYDLGGDSLAAARILTGVRKRFGVSITLDRLHEVLTVRAMAACVEAGRAARNSQSSQATQPGTVAAQ
jgi:pyochelin synthetase